LVFQIKTWQQQYQVHLRLREHIQVRHLLNQNDQSFYQQYLWVNQLRSETQSCLGFIFRLSNQFMIFLGGTKSKSVELNQVLWLINPNVNEDFIWHFQPMTSNSKWPPHYFLPQTTILSTWLSQLLTFSTTSLTQLVDFSLHLKPWLIITLHHHVFQDTRIPNSLAKRLSLISQTAIIIL
jgi:hypothetical protein